MSIDISIDCLSTLDRHVDRVSTTLDRYVGRVSIAGIDRHLAAGAFSTHDPKFLTQHHSKLNIIDMNNNYICKLRSQNLRGILCNQMLLWRTAAFKSFTCCFVILTSKRHRSSRWGTQLRCRVRTLTPSPRGFHDKLSKCRLWAWCRGLAMTAAGLAVKLISSSINVSSPSVKMIWDTRVSVNGCD